MSGETALVASAEKKTKVKRSMFGNLKDSLASSAAKSLLAGKIDRYGRLTDLRIHSRERRIYVEVLLSGEKEEISIEVTRYRISGKSGEHQITLEEVACSRQWLQLLLEDFLIGKPLPVPSVALIALGGAEE